MAKSKPSFGAKADETEKVEHDGHCHEELDAKIEALEGKVSDLENKLKGLLEDIEAASKIKGELELVKSHLSAEIKELSSKASAQVVSKLDANGDGKINFEEVYSYVHARMKSRDPNPRK